MLFKLFQSLSKIEKSKLVILAKKSLRSSIIVTSKLVTLIGTLVFSSTSFGYAVNGVEGSGSPVAIGGDSVNTATATGNYATSVGANSKATGGVASAFGDNAKATGNESTAIGYMTAASGVKSTALGVSSEASASNSLAVGDSAKATANSAISIGNMSKSTVESGVAIGTNSVSNTLAGTSPYIISKSSEEHKKRVLDTIGTGGAVSFGRNRETNEENALYRQLTNVAAGSSDTDAVNVAQLKAVESLATKEGNYESLSVGKGSNNSLSFVGDEGLSITDKEGNKLNLTASNIVAKNAEGKEVEAKLVTLDADTGKSKTGTRFAIRGGKETLFAESQSNFSGENVATHIDPNGVISMGIAKTPHFDRITVGEAGKLGTITLDPVSGLSIVNKDGKDTLALGSGAKSTAESAIAIGAESKAAGERGIALGQQANSGGSDSLALGAGSSAPGQNAVALGRQANSSGNNSMALGSGATAPGQNAVAVGRQANSSGNNSIALGSGAAAPSENAVALGANSVADRDNSVSVGSPGYERQVTNVAPGTHDTDAANISQLNSVRSTARSAHGLAQKNTSRINNLENQLSKTNKKIDRGLAASAALTGLFQPYGVGNVNFTAGMGTYGSSVAMAVGSGYRINEHAAIKAGLAYSGGNNVTSNASFNLEW
ncbi:YadA-like family protein [Sodalis endosymbiont of Spalangia cameroni]|uniref:YadA family autotransporter adhesin n=1 Tax=Sodalis praecaptivus TaxID=1239307 RepID=UPI0031FA152C